MNKHLKHELDTEANLLKRHRIRMNILRLVENLGLKDAYRSPKLLPVQKTSLKLLKQQYDTLQAQLNRQYPEATTRTASERTVFDKIRCATNLVFCKSIWIGNRNVDLFCPAVGTLHRPVLKGQKIDRTPVMRGLVVEVDGTIHNRELKMKKDTSKYQLIHDLDIGLTVLHNESIHESGINNFINQLIRMPRLDSRARQRLLRKIYIVTLAYHASDEVMASLYGPQFADLSVGDPVTLKGVV